MASPSTQEAHQHAPTDVLQSHAHNTEDVVDAVARSLRSSALARDEEPLSELLAWLEKWDDRWQEVEYIQHLLTLLSKTFLLSPLPTLTFAWDEDEGLKHDRYGSCHASPDNDSIHIIVDPTDHHLDRGNADHRSALLSTIIHELCHAVLSVWGCGGRCGREKCVARTEKVLGRTGHGKGWFLLAAYVETAARKRLEGWDIRLNVLGGAMMECVYREDGGDEVEKIEISLGKLDGGTMECVNSEGVPGVPEWTRLYQDLDEAELASLLEGASELVWEILDKLKDAQQARRGHDMDSLAWLKRWLLSQRQ